MPELHVHFLPELIGVEDLAGGTCVVIDVLRATTTMVYALAAGARAVAPCLTIEDARERANASPISQAILGGERGGVRIEGFDFGNSPAEYTAASVGGKTVVLTTTNGTKALLHCRQADAVLIAGFVNLSAVCVALSARSRGQVEGTRVESTPGHPTARTVHLLCSGTENEITREDVLLAGAIVARLTEAAPYNLSDQAVIARDAWLRIMAHAATGDVQPRLVEALRASHGGRNLIRLELDADIRLAAEVDRFAIVPRFEAATGLITAG